MSAIAKEHMNDMLSFGEAYMVGAWDAEDLEQTLIQIGLDRKMPKAVNRPRPQSSPETVIKAHYDIGNDLFEAMLGETMAYTCGYWRAGAQSLDEAQRDKFGLIVDKLELKPGMTVLDLGCGFGSFAKYCREQELGVTVDGVTLSAEQAKIASKHCFVKVCDYREANGVYDRVISLGLLEHVGRDGYREYFKTVSRHLKPDGIHLCQTIANNVSHRMVNPWIDKHIFPNSMLPSLKQICQASERLLVIEDVENFGPDYAKTCRAWWENCKNSDIYRFGSKYSPEFWRMWEFYLIFSAVAFHNRDLQLFQVVQTKKRLEQPRRV